MPCVARLATKDNRKHCFYRSLIDVRRLLRAFSTAAYPMCIWVLPPENLSLGFLSKLRLKQVFSAIQTRHNIHGIFARSMVSHYTFQRANNKSAAYHINLRLCC